DSPKAYLAQHALLDQLDSLDSVPIPDYASLLPSDKDPLVNVFIGPSGTISPLHFDPRPNFFCQIRGRKFVRLIRGRKFVRLINPKYQEDVYLNSDPMYANSSEADFENLDFEKYPRLKEVEMEDVILEEGECLYMPEKYFHLMRSLSPSISVSIWI
uniref:JmjC domain-containing protein n=1 Tax=Panagrolaimus sp. ES5 TaxID=591445 RepID=A0AC34G587_9BILA